MHLKDCSWQCPLIWMSLWTADPAPWCLTSFLAQAMAAAILQGCIEPCPCESLN